MYLPAPGSWFIGERGPQRHMCSLSRWHGVPLLMFWWLLRERSGAEGLDALVLPHRIHTPMGDCETRDWHSGCCYTGVFGSQSKYTAENSLFSPLGLLSSLLHPALCLVRLTSLDSISWLSPFPLASDWIFLMGGISRRLEGVREEMSGHLVPGLLSCYGCFAAPGLLYPNPQLLAGWPSLQRPSLQCQL